MRSRNINGTLFPSEKASIARQQPNLAADAIWHEWELARLLPITKADILRLGKDPSTAYKLDDAIWGLGDDAYGAQLDVFHQLHCLNSLRQIAYGTYYNRSMANPVESGIQETHINHCVDILMQALQCSANVNLVTMHWVETQPYPFPDFSINRQCIAFDDLTRWRIAESIDIEKYKTVIKKPEGVKEKPASEQMRKYANEQEHAHGHRSTLGPDRH